MKSSSFSLPARRLPLLIGFSQAMGAAVLGLFSLLPPSAWAQVNVPEHDGVADRIKRFKGLVKFQRVPLQLPAKPKGPIRFRLPLGAAMQTVELLPVSVRSAAYRTYIETQDGQLEPAPLGEIGTFRGHIPGLDGSFVAGALSDEGLSARILLPDHSEFWVEPVGRQIGGGEEGDHIVYRNEDVLEHGGTCAAKEFEHLAGALADASTSSLETSDTASGPLRVAELACDADYEYFIRWGSIQGVIDRIESIVNAVNVQFERDVGITHVITSIIVRTNSNDPYTGTDPAALLTQFRDHWNANHSSIPRDLAHLFTGRDLDGSVIGIAWLNAVCGSYGYGLSQSDFASGFACVTDLTAHELGHNWGAGHCTCSGYTMNASITCANRFDPVHTIPAIVAFRDSRNCLEDGALAPPFAPSHLVASASSDTVVVLDWVDADDTEQGFDIERSVDGVNWQLVGSVGANTVSFANEGLAPATAYFYRVQAYNVAGSSDYSNTASVQTEASPAPPTSPSALEAEAVSDDEIALNWIDHSNDEEGFELERLEGEQWLLTAALAPDSVSYRDSGLNAATTYAYRVRAYNSGGASTFTSSASATTHDPPAQVYQLAHSEQAGAGSVYGDYNLTWDNDGLIQSIQESSSGGRPSLRYGFLEHTWEFTVEPGSAMTLFANVWAGPSSDGENFDWTYSSDGKTYVPMFSVSSKNTDNKESYLFPQSISGVVYVRVTDSNRVPGDAELDSIYIDQLYIQSDLVSGSPPSAPSDLVSGNISSSRVALQWRDNAIDEYGFEVGRSTNGSPFEQIATVSADTTTFMDEAVRATTSYAYRVWAFNGGGYSASSNEIELMTPEGIELLSAVGSKVKGSKSVSLSWGGQTAGRVLVYRNGERIATVANDGEWTDLLGKTSTSVFEYQLCDEASPSSWSNTLTVNF